MPPKLLKASSSSQKISNFLNRDRPSELSTTQNHTGGNVFTVDDVELKQANKLTKKPEIFDPKELEEAIKSHTETGDVNTAISIVLKAYSSLAKAVETNYNNCSNTAQIVDETTSLFQTTSEQLNDKITRLSKDHHAYVESNENDKQQIILKTDIRHFKYHMIIFLKNDSILANSNDNEAIAIAEKIIKDQGLSLGRAYITKAIILSGMKRINNINRLTNYIYVYFSDGFTSERLMTEMIKKNKQSSNVNNPDIIFTQPSSYDVNKIKRICHELQNDKTVSKVFLGDDSIKVTLNKTDPNDLNERPKKFHVRNFSDLDKLRSNVSAKNNHIPSRTFYNNDYWQNKYPQQENKRKEKRKLCEINFSKEKRRADDSLEINEPSPSSRKQRRLSDKPPQKDKSRNTRDDSMNASFTSTTSTEL